MHNVLTEEQRRIMPLGLRYTIYVVFGGVWLTGCASLVLHTYFETPDEFGAARHPWEPPLLWVHGALGIALAYVIGWIMARHASEAWRQKKRRISGGLLTCVTAVLSISGFMLFFVTSDAWQLQSARVHQVVGLLITLFAIEHWRVLNGRSRDAE